MLGQQSDLLPDYLRKWETFSTGTQYCHAIFRYLARAFQCVLPCSFGAQNMNWIRKRLEDSRNKLGGLYQGPTSTTEVYEVYTVRPLSSFLFSSLSLSLSLSVCVCVYLSLSLAISISLSSSRTLSLNITLWSLSQSILTS